MPELIIKEPLSELELRAMWQLNHAVFADELQQHPHHADQMLIDKFHHKNRYRIAWDGSTVQGMICAHSEAPYSTTGHFGALLDSVIIPGATAEIRLFALRPAFRVTTLAARLATPLLLELQARGIRQLIISGIETRRDFYENVGFTVTGEAVAEGNSRFYPMTATLDRVLHRCEDAMRRVMQHD